MITINYYICEMIAATGTIMIAATGTIMIAATGTIM